VRALVQGTLDAYDAGISIVGVQLERADPPTEVADAFEEVQRAQQDLNASS
jgi:membrane protease subunit HflK